MHFAAKGARHAPSSGSISLLPCEPHPSSAPEEAEAFTGHDELQVLLAQQLQAAQDVITLNQALIRRLGHTSHADEAAVVSPSQCSARSIQSAPHGHGHGHGHTRGHGHGQPPDEAAAIFGKLLFHSAVTDIESMKDKLDGYYDIARERGVSSKFSNESTPENKGRDVYDDVQDPLSYQGASSSLTMPLLAAQDSEVKTWQRRKKPFQGLNAPKKKSTVPATVSKKQEYNVEDLYNQDGCAQAVARNMYFQNSTLIVIVMNTFWMAVDTDLNKAEVLCEAALIFQIADNFFCTYFTFEIMIRLLAFKDKYMAFSDGWFVFDSSLVLLMVWETWINVIIYKLSNGDNQMGGDARSMTILRLFRAFRLLRISRMTRLLRSMPELFILVKSIGAAMRCMLVTLCMLLLVIYIFSIMFTQLLSGSKTGHGKFDHVPQAMNYMLLQVLCGFDADFVTVLLEAGFVYYLLWLLYVLIGSLSIMNVLIGILCEVVSGTADQEKERAVRKDIEMGVVSQEGIDENELLSKSEMMKTLETPSVCMKLEEMGVDVHSLLDFVHFFDEGTELTLADFIEMVVHFRGSKVATVRDIVDFRNFVSMEVSILENQIANSRPCTVTAADA